MSNYSKIVVDLQSERIRLQKELRRLDDAISALTGHNGAGNTKSISRGPRRQLSAAARKRIADAQRQRWAKFRQQKAGARKAA